MNLGNPVVRYLLIGAILGGAFIVCHLIDHAGSVAR